MLMYIGLAALFLMVIGLIYIGMYDKKKKSIPYWNDIVGFVAAISIIAAAILAPLVAISASVDDIVAENVAEYEELMIYKNTVEKSTNEYLRWNYYEKVEDWNRRYDINEEIKQNPSFWFGCYQYDYFVGTSRIEFELHGDE